MKEMFSQYVFEREDVQTLSTDKGFVLYKFEDNHIAYISDIFVLKEYRNAHVAKNLADKVSELALKSGYKHLVGSVDVRTNNYETSIDVLKAYGMQEFKRIEFMIFFIKELK